MAGEAAKVAREREREAYEKTQVAHLPPTDPIRRAKLLDGVPAPADVGAPNGTAGKDAGAGESPVLGAGSTAQTQGPATPLHMPEIEPTVAQESRPAKNDGAPNLSSTEAKAAAVAGPDGAAQGAETK